MMRRFVIFLKAIRALESTLMIGFPLVGALFALENLSSLTLSKLLHFLPPTYGLVIFVYAMNSWGSIEFDRRNERLGRHPVLTGEITPSQLLAVAMIGLISSFVLYLLWLPRCFAMASAIACNWTLYSHPQILWKSKPIYGSMVHLVGGVLQFLLGWLILQPLTLEGVALAVYFAAVFTAGHMNHEVKDHDADKAAGVVTNAVAFGPRRMLHVAFALFSLSAVYLLMISRAHIAPWSLTWPFLAIFPIHAAAHVMMLPPEGEAYRVSYQLAYRSLYAAAGAAIFFAQIVRLWNI